MLAGWLASPLVKLAGLAAIILALIGAGEWHGRKAVQEQWDAAIGKQATKTISDVIAAEVNKANAQVVYVQQKAKVVVKEKIIEKEVVAYGDSPETKCLVDDEFVRAFDDLSRLLNTGADSLPAADGAAGDPAAATHGPVTTVEILRAYQAAIFQAGADRQGYQALSDWNRSDYALRKAQADQ